MLKISRKAEYALLALRRLSSLPGEDPAATCTARELARGLAAPPELLSKVLQSLARAGIVRSEKGVRGGYALARPAGSISLADLVEAVDGPVAVVDCLQEPEGCDRRRDCCLQAPLEELNRELKGLLQGLTLDRFPAPQAQAPPALEA